jgi:choline dehydrogenase-like flavoprotein
MIACHEPDVLVIGSGAGGALTAATLAESAMSVLVVEEGERVSQEEVAPFSLEQMRRQYRNAGLTCTLGRVPIAYAEGCCVGGGTEVNSGLYHRTPPGVLAQWRGDWAVRELEEEQLAPHYESVERALSVSTLPGEAPRASRVLAEGAAALGWSSQEVPRAFRYLTGTQGVRKQGVTGTHGARKQSMTETYLPRAQAAGASILTGCRVLRLERSRAATTTAVCSVGGRRELIRARWVFVCAGAIGTAALLQRSGLRRGVGANLRVHPTVKAAAEFPVPLEAAADVPVHQVKEFGPDLSFGGSASGPGHVAAALAENWRRDGVHAGDSERIAVYYAAIRSAGKGRVLALPGVSEPVVTYRLTRGDIALLRSGLRRLTHMLLAAGALAVYPCVHGAPVARRESDVAGVGAALRRGSMRPMTVHLCSTVPLGEDERRCAVDSWGRARGWRGLYVNDGSLLPSAPGVNPQGTIMALAARNCARFLEIRGG